MVPIKLFAFDALSCGLQAASLMDRPLLPAMFWPLLILKWVDECTYVILFLLHYFTPCPMPSLAIVLCHPAIALGVEGRGRR